MLYGDGTTCHSQLYGAEKERPLVTFNCMGRKTERPLVTGWVGTVEYRYVKLTDEYRVEYSTVLL
jgi:hypothetical protein